jgi:hypothetical protein
MGNVPKGASQQIVLVLQADNLGCLFHRYDAPLLGFCGFNALEDEYPGLSGQGSFLFAGNGLKPAPRLSIEINMRTPVFLENRLFALFHGSPSNFA